MNIKFYKVTSTTDIDDRRFTDFPTRRIEPTLNTVVFETVYGTITITIPIGPNMHGDIHIPFEVLDKALDAHITEPVEAAVMEKLMSVETTEKWHIHLAELTERLRENTIDVVLFGQHGWYLELLAANERVRMITAEINRHIAERPNK